MKALVLTARGLRADVLGCYGAAWALTPALDALAEQGVVFDRHYADRADAAGARRAWRDGRYRLPTPGAADDGPPGDDLIARLRGKGAHTCLVVDDGRPAPAEFEAGWDEVVRSASPDAAVEAARAALGRLTGRGDWLLWVDFGAPLPPWDAPDEFVAPFFSDAADDEGDDGRGGEDEDAAAEAGEGDEDPLAPIRDPAEGPVDADDDVLYSNLQSTYAAAVSYLDACVGALLAALIDLAAEEEPLVVFTSDRGYPLGEHGVVGPVRPWPHAEAVHLPLLLRLPGGDEAGRRVDALTQAVDLAATLADAFGVELPDAHGHSLLPLVYGEAEQVRGYACSGLRDRAAVEWALRTPEWAFLLPVGAEETPPRGPRLYVQPDDRREVNDVRQHHLELTDGLERTLRAFVGASRRAGPFQAPPLPEGEAPAEALGGGASR
jgi:arylsulfatase A-like enzyme